MMHQDFYLKRFQKAADQLDKKMLQKKHLEVGVGVFLASACLKLYKKEWTNNIDDPMNATTRIFFSIWVSDKTIQEKKIFYNIHAFKLRQLKGYAISSRIFANNFREQFKVFENDWENVSVKFGPLTLMEGWEELDDDNFDSVVAKLANNFLGIEYLIDETLKTFKNQKP